VCSAREVENAKHLDKLPHEVWGKILDTLKENDLFPLALSCRYFRQKQKELVERMRQNGPESVKPRFALRTTLTIEANDCVLASAEYVRFCSKEKALKDVGLKIGKRIRCLAAFHGYLPLLQELLACFGQRGTLLSDFHLAEVANNAGGFFS